MGKPASGEIYRHFEGKIYQICMLAKDAENGRELVVYQAMYPPFTCFVRSLEEFMSLVDKEKYPEAKQQRRFARVPMERFSDKKETVESKLESMSEPVDELVSKPIKKPIEPLSEEELEKILCYGNIDKYIDIRITEEELKERGLMLFFDAEDIGKKRRIFASLGPHLTEVMLHNIAVTLDLVLEETEREDQYDAILKCLGTREHYEGGRLR